MPGPKRGFTTPHTCVTVDSLARNQPLQRDRKAREKLQEKVSGFQVTFDDNILLCCSNVPLSVTPFQFNLEFETTHRVALCVVHSRYSKSNRMNNKSQN